MISKYKFIIFTLLLIIGPFVFSKGASAAKLILVPENKTVKIGEEVNVNLILDTENESINAVQAAIQFPSGIFEATKIDKTDSILNFWLVEPTFSNENGEAKFIGGTPKGVSGKSLQILKLTLKANGAGLAEIILSEAAVSASDGQGTNVLSMTQSTTINAGAQPILIPDLPATGEPVKSVALPKIITRSPIPEKNLPLVPAIKVAIYPDTAEWYNHLGQVIALWNVPADVTNVSTAFNKNPNTVPTIVEKELTTGKNFGLIKEGIWYVHVRFKNNIGWGSVAHYKISLDTTPPLPFEVKIDDAASDNPNPQITFDAQDAFSGISYANILVDGKEVSRTTSASTTLPVQAPGTHTLLVKVFDRAGNSVEDDLQFEILPLARPIVEFVSRSITQIEPIFASGTAIPNVFVDVMAQDASQHEVFTTTTQSDNSGNWKIAVDKALPTGKYSLTAMARDERGAKSFVTAEEYFKVTPKIILSLGRFINLDWFEIFFIFMVLVAAAASMIYWWYAVKKNIHEAYRIILARDIGKWNTLLLRHVKELEDMKKLSEPSRSVNISVSIGRMKAMINRMKKYIDVEVNKLKK